MVQTKDKMLNKPIWALNDSFEKQLTAGLHKQNTLLQM